MIREFIRWLFRRSPPDLMSNDQIDFDEMARQVEEEIKSLPGYGTKFILSGSVKCEPYHKRSDEG